MNKAVTYAFFWLIVVTLGTGIRSDEDLKTWNDIFGRKFEARLISSRPGFVRLQNKEGKEIDFPSMNLVPRDQTFVREWEKQKAEAAKGSEFVQTFKKDLVIKKGNKVSSYEPETMSQIKYFAFYKSASWCPPCQKFTPKLVNFYNRIKDEHPEFELIFISSDRSEDAMEDYMVDYDMPWPAFEHGEHKRLVRSNGGGIPCLIVTDADGTKLLDSYTKSGSYKGPSSVMRELEDLLK